MGTPQTSPREPTNPLATPLPVVRRESRQAFHQHVLRGWQALTHQPIGTRMVLAWKLLRRKKLEGSLAMLRQRTCPITAALLSEDRVKEREATYRDRRKARLQKQQD